MAQKASAKKSTKKAPSPKKAAAPAKKAAPAPKSKASKPLTTKASSGNRQKPEAPAKVEKPAKVSAGLSKSDLQYFRNLLLEKRREILGDVSSMESEAFKTGSNLSNMPIHMADVGTDNFEQEFTLGLIESERQTLREIQEALARIDDGSFGICLGTGKPISRVRLEAVPYAKYCMEYAKALDSGQVRRESGRGGDEDAGGDDDEE